ncbi:MAG: right-handed parallel beta-helix repeat-containing protein, partial [Calditrichaeota bacterium]|nr:right-handed parallel beta-helix repeat-containing protein [Calditrichota bacterium]
MNSPGSSVDSCIFSGQTFPASFSAAVYANLCPDFRVSGNVFQDLDNAVSIFGEPVSSTTPGLLIENNQIAVPERSGIFIVAMSAPVVRGNRITSQSAYPVIDLVDCINGTQVTGNYIRQTPGEQRDPAVGLQLFDCQGNGERALLANNMILSTANDSLSNTIGIYLFSSSSVDVVFNNVHIRGDNHPNDPGTGYALLASQNADDLRLFNNHLTVTQHGYAYALLSPNLQIADYNLLHSASNFLVQTGGTTYFTLEQLQQATGQESHSLAVPPQYRALDDLHLAGRFADGAGLPFAGIATDIDGEPRDPQSPDIGADEYSPMDAGMSGTFSIGADNADFEDFSAAIQHLHMLGINGPVTFAIQSGLYTEKIYLPEFAGSSPARRITFRSASGRPQDVELRYLPQPQGFGGMVQFDRADYITLGQLTFAGQLDGGISKPILAIQRGSVGISLVQNRFIPDPGPANAVMLFTQGDSASAADSLVITGNTFIGGKISIRGSESRGLQSLRFSGNRFSLDDDSQYAMDVQYVTDFDLSNNLIVLTNQRQSTTGFSGVLVSGTSGDLLVSGNRFQVDGARRIGALNIYHHQDGGSPGRVNNNFISVRADSQHYGIYVEDSRLEIDFNSVYLTGGSATNRQSRGSAIVIEKTLSDPRVPRLRNNIFANRGGGFALYGNRLGNNFDSDYNDLYSTGSFLVRYNNASGAPVYYADLPGFRAATNLDRNSLSVSPRFASDTDLHLTDNQALNDAGIPLSRINRDIDRQQRNAATPDIGADEYSPGRGTIKIRGGISVRIPARQSVSDIFEVSLFPNKVADGYRLTDLNVGIDTLLVANVGDIDLILTHEGVSDTLVYNLSSGGSHFLNTLFDDSAAQAIDQGSAPFSGIFRPYGSLARFQGLDPEGDWELRIANSGEDTTGVLRGWRLDLAFEYVTGVGGEQPRV